MRFNNEETLRVFYHSYGFFLLHSPGPIGSVASIPTVAQVVSLVGYTS